MEGARIYAQNAIRFALFFLLQTCLLINYINSIREKNQVLNYLRLASRIDAVAARVDTAMRMRSVRLQLKFFHTTFSGSNANLTSPPPKGHSIDGEHCARHGRRIAKHGHTEDLGGDG